MSCLLTYHSGPHSHVLVKGHRPSRPVNWKIDTWFTLEGGEKHTHSAKVALQTVTSLVPYMGVLIDSLIDDHGNQVTSAGWTARVVK